MKVLGIDQSYSSCGLMLINNHKIAASELFKADNKKTRFEQAFQLASQIGTFCLSNEPDWICLEGLAFAMRGNATRDLAGLQFVIVVHLIYRCSYADKYSIVPPNTLKKFATDKGNAKKEQLYEHLPVEARNYIDDTGVKKSTGRYDLTDAYWLAKYGLHHQHNNKNVY